MGKGGAGTDGHNGAQALAGNAAEWLADWFPRGLLCAGERQPNLSTIRRAVKSVDSDRGDAYFFNIKYGL